MSFSLFSSNLGNFLRGSPHRAEAEETRRLYDQARALWEASALSDPARETDFIIDIILEAGQRAGGHPTIPLGEALFGLLLNLIREDGLLFRFPEVTSFEALSIDEGIALRKRLRRIERFFANEPFYLDIWQEKIIRIIEGIVGYLPDSFLAEDRAAYDASGEPAPLNVPLIELCHDPAEVVERTIFTLFSDDVFDAGIFEPLRERYDINLLIASGINPDYRYDVQKALVFPTQARGMAPSELAARYCAGTAFKAFFEEPLPFAIPFPARFEHTHIIGGTGHGKTQLLQSMIYEDLQKAQEDKRALVVIDSQGDLIRNLSNLSIFSPTEGHPLSERVVIVDPTDIAFPVSLNLFDWSGNAGTGANDVEREKLLNAAVSLYEYIFGALLGAELTMRQGVIFKYIARLMLEIPDATIHTLADLMQHGERYKLHMARLQGSARDFFETRFFDRSFGETKKQILTRLWGVLSHATLERMFGAPKNKIDLDDALNHGKIVLINTAKDFLTAEGSALLGRFFIAMITQTAMRRASWPPHERRPAFVYIDEAADYFDDNIGQLLNQARKFKVGLVLAHQNLDQLSPALRATLSASTAIKFAGGVNAKDARALADDMHSEADFLQSMRKRKDATDFACYVRHFTPQALRVTVSLGRIEELPAMSWQEHQVLLQRNRERHCVPMEEAVRRRPAIPELPEPVRQEPKTAVPRPAPQPLALPPSVPPPLVRKEEPLEPAVAEMASTPASGRGGKRHQYLQMLIKTVAEQQGFRAVIEEPILGGIGRVDVALFKGPVQIAVEISVTTGKDQELANIEKCLAAGYEQVILIAPEEKHLRAMRRFIEAQLEDAHRNRVLFFTPDAFIAHLGPPERTTEETEHMVRGYRVKVTRDRSDTPEAQARRRAIAEIIAKSMRREEK